MIAKNDILHYTLIVIVYLQSITADSYDVEYRPKTIPCLARQGEYLEYSADSGLVARPCPADQYNDKACHNDPACKLCIDGCTLTPKGTYEAFVCDINKGPDPEDCECKHEDGYRKSDDGRTCVLDLEPTRVSIKKQSEADLTDTSGARPASAVSSSNVGLHQISIILGVILSVILAFAMALISILMYRKFRGANSDRNQHIEYGEREEVLPADGNVQGEQSSLSSSSASDEAPLTDEPVTVEINGIGIKVCLAMFAQLSHKDQDSRLFDIEDILCTELSEAESNSFAQHLVKLTLSARPLYQSPEEGSSLTTGLLAEKDNIIDFARIQWPADPSEKRRCILAECRKRSTTYELYLSHILSALQRAQCFLCLRAICDYMKARHNPIITV